MYSIENMNEHLMLDLSKAFDSIQHAALFNKLRVLGLTDEALSWVKSYLDDRQQQVRISSSLSTPITIDHRVPQGSILGPLLFNLYINDLLTACINSFLESFMDNSKLYLAFSKKQMDKGLEDLRQDLHRVLAWCCNNSLLINPDKTKFCVFRTS